MKLKLDENFPRALADALKGLGHDVETALQEELAGASDERLWESAQEESRLFVTQDMDFSDLRKFIPGTHSGVLLVRLHAPSWKRLSHRVSEVFRTEKVDSWVGCFVVVSEAKVRVVRQR
jgi:predicted nuclease of predicted toxin-antitoxin system